MAFFIVMTACCLVFFDLILYRWRKVESAPASADASAVADMTEAFDSVSDEVEVAEVVTSETDIGIEIGSSETEAAATETDSTDEESAVSLAIDVASIQTEDEADEADFIEIEIESAASETEAAVAESETEAMDESDEESAIVVASATASQVVQVASGLILSANGNTNVCEIVAAASVTEIDSTDEESVFSIAIGVASSQVASGLIPSGNTSSELPSIQQPTLQNVRKLSWAKKYDVKKGFLAQYEVLSLLGKGSFGSVFEAKLKCNSSSGRFAVKVISKTNMSSAQSEIRFLKKLGGENVNILKHYETYEDFSRIHIVTELCTGGNLFERLQSSGGRFEESEAKKWMTQALNAVAFCHSRKIVHRDIKLENFMCTTRDESCIIKLIDFGLSSSLLPGERLDSISGTPLYMAPEVLAKHSGYESDAWSLGVMAYVLLAGEFPFKIHATRQGRAIDFSSKPNFRGPAWRSVSSKAKDFIKRLLNPNPAKRMTVQEAQRHGWLTASKSGPNGRSRFTALFSCLSGRVGPTSANSYESSLP